MILACIVICMLSHRNLELRNSMMVWSIVTEKVYERIDSPAAETLKDHLESIKEELYEYAWTTQEVSYRKGPDESYESAGRLDADRFIKRTGVTYGGWSRISIDDEEYYIPNDAVSTDVPDSIPIWDGIKGEYQKYALSRFSDFGWDDSELEPLIYLWDRESRWNPAAHNSSSGAHGIPQALPGSKMSSEGSDYYTNAETQIRWGLKYIAGRYGSPSAAWAHSNSYGWY